MIALWTSHLIEIKALRPRRGYHWVMDHSTPDPHYEIQSVGRTLDDLAPETAPRPGGVIRPLIWSAVGLVLLLGFVGVLLVGPQLMHMVAHLFGR